MKKIISKETVRNILRVIDLLFELVLDKNNCMTIKHKLKLQNNQAGKVHLPYPKSNQQGQIAQFI